METWGVVEYGREVTSPCHPKKYDKEFKRNAVELLLNNVRPPGDARVDYTVRSTIGGLEMCMQHSKYEER